MDSFSQEPREHIKDFIVKVSKLYGIKNLEGTLMAGHPNGELFQNKLEDQIEEIESEFFKLKEDLFSRLKDEKLPAPEFHPWKFVPMGKGWIERELQTIQEVLPIPGLASDKPYLAYKERLRNIDAIRSKYNKQFELHKGLDSLSDYYALNFKCNNFVVFESMVYGNAIYAVRGDWNDLSRLTKATLKKDHFANPIKHKGPWKTKLNQAIKRNLRPEKSQDSELIS
jgi:hypothetical protein